MKKVIIIILVLISILLLIFLVYAKIMTLGNQWEKVVEVPKELKKLEKEIQSETGHRDFNFHDILGVEYENCDIKLEAYLKINNDSISKSEKSVEKYINGISKRVNNTLINKKCFNRLIIEVSSYYHKGKIESEVTKQYRYSFPIK